MKLMHGDCLELMREIPDGSVDMVLADLPYGTTSNRWDSVIPFEPLWEQYHRVCKRNAAICLFGQMPFSAALVMSKLQAGHPRLSQRNRPSAPRQGSSTRFAGGCPHAHP